MTKVSNEQIQKIAKLSRISLNKNEINDFASQVSDIIEWVEKLNEVDTKHITPMMAVADKLTMRPDIINVQNESKEILDNCTDTQYNFYAVPKFIE